MIDSVWTNIVDGKTCESDFWLWSDLLGRRAVKTDGVVFAFGDDE